MARIHMPTYTFLVFYKIRPLSPEEEERARREWSEILEKWPSKIRLTGIFDHAWGTSYNGFMVIECEDYGEYVKFWKWFKDQIRWYVIETRTVIGVRR